MNLEKYYYFENKKQWNERTKIHINSKFYDIESFLTGRSSLNNIELKLLGKLTNKSLLHLQCHFGQDTLSLNRMGAKTVGVDISDEAISEAENLNKKLGLSSKFICCNLYDSPNHIKEKFDVVFSSYGTIGWLKDIDKWAKIISHFLKSGGEFIFVEFHPFLWIYDDDFEYLKYPYFHTSEPIEEELTNTYTDSEKELNVKSFSWNHSLSEVFTALINNGLTIETFQEYDYSPYNCFPNMVEKDKGKFVIKKLNSFIPHLYSLKAIKKK